MTEIIEPSRLPDWSNDYRGLPNALARSALFTVSREGPRKQFNNEIISSSSDATIVYRGEELRQEDEDVFLQILHYAKEQQLGENISFSANAMIVALGRTSNRASYDRLIDSLKRMTGMLLEISVRLPDGAMVRYGGSLIVDYTVREKDSGGDKLMQYWVVSLNKTIVRLFDPQAYSLIHWPTRQGLSPMAKWLHVYYSTHKKPFPVKVLTLRKAMASETKLTRAFRSNLKDSLNVLVEKGFFLSFKIDPKSDLVIVERAADKKLLE
jgi:hypothetical protein